MAKRDTLESLLVKLAEVRLERERQMQHIGLRLGVFAELRRLDKRERVLMARYGYLTVQQGMERKVETVTT